MRKVILRFAIAFVSRLYTLFILLAIDPFDVSGVWFKVNYNPPFWVFWLLLSIAIVSAVLWAVRDVKKQSRETDYLNDIKNDLITLNTHEKDIATKKTKRPLAKNKVNKIKTDFREYITNIGVPIFTGLLELKSKEQLVDSLIKFFVGIGDVLDINDYGLKIELADVVEYNDAKESIAQKQIKLKGKKQLRVQTHTRKVMMLTYGLNSVIVFRHIYRLSPEFQKAIPVKFNMMVESVERTGEKFLTEMLNNLDRDWEKVIKIDFDEI